MLNTVEFIAENLSRVTAEDIARFSKCVDIRDPLAFAAELQTFMHERVEGVALPLSLEVGATEQMLMDKAVALRAKRRWAPSNTDIQRGRTILLEAFDQPHNLPLARFAALANKSRQQIYKDIEARRLFSLSVGKRGQKLPDWQLDAVKQQLTQAVLKMATDIDEWTLYRALSEPIEGLSDRAPLDAVTADSIDDLTKVVCNLLGIH